MREHPSRGVGEAYSIEFRTCCMELAQTGILADQRFVNLQNQHIFPSQRTLQRWRRRVNEFGNLRRFKRTGNRFATVLRGRILFLLLYIG